jgi:protein TonB
MSPKRIVRQQPEIPPPPQPQVLESVAGTSPVPIAPPPPPSPVPDAAPVAPAAPAPPAPRIAARFDADYLKNPPPAYPAMSRRYGEQGQVMLKVLVSTEGTAKRVQIDRSSGFPRLDEAAHDAVHQWRFVPARRGTEPIEDWVLVPIVFRLSS